MKFMNKLSVSISIIIYILIILLDAPYIYSDFHIPHSELSTSLTWPTYRGGNARAGIALTELPDTPLEMDSFYFTNIINANYLLASETTIFVSNSEGTIGAFSRDGSELWKTVIPDANEPVLSSDKLFITANSSLYIVDTLTGNWTKHDFDNKLVSTPLIINDVVYLTASNGTNGTLYLYNPESNITSSVNIPEIPHGLITATSTRLFFITENNTLFSYDTNLNYIWNQTFEVPLVPVLVTTTNKLIATSTDGALFVFYNNNGTLIWSKNVTSSSFNYAPLIYQNTIIIMDANGTLFSYNLESGSEIFSLETALFSTIDLLITNTGKIILLSGTILYILNYNGTVSETLDVQEYIQAVLPIENLYLSLANKSLVKITNYIPRLTANIKLSKTTIVTGEQISGLINVSYSGQQIDNATVTITSSLQAELQPASGVSNSDGIFSFIYIAPYTKVDITDKLVATISKPGYRNVSTELSVTILARRGIDVPRLKVNKETIEVGYKNVTFSGGSTNDIIVYFTERGTNIPAKNVTVNVSVSFGSIPKMVFTTSDNGTISFSLSFPSIKNNETGTLTLVVSNDSLYYNNTIIIAYTVTANIKESDESIGKFLEKYGFILIILIIVLVMIIALYILWLRRK